MKIQGVKLSYLRNDEHFQFHTEFLDLVNVSEFSFRVLKQMETYVRYFRQEDEALKKVMKSAITSEMHDADQERDRAYRGLVNAHQAALDHYEAAKRMAAFNLSPLFGTYRNLDKKPLNEETSAVYNFVKDLEGEKYKADAKIAGLDAWAVELNRLNRVFEALVKKRYDEAAERTALVLRTVRTEVDEAYHVVADRIDALALLREDDDEEDYDAFIRRLNVVIEKYNNILAQRRGRHGKKDEEKGEEVI